MDTNVQISPKWVEQLVSGKPLEVAEEVLNSLNKKVVTIEAVRGIDAMEAYNDLISIQVKTENGGKRYLKNREFIYVGPDGANFCVVAQIEAIPM